MNDFKALESLLKNRNAILEFIKDDMPQTDDVKELTGVVESFYHQHILLECQKIAFNIDNFIRKDDDVDDCAEVDYD